jgi:hypothetical protein
LAEVTGACIARYHVLTMKREIDMTTPLDPIVSEFATVEEAEAYDKWFRAKVRRSMADPRPRIPHDEAMARIRTKLQAKIKKEQGSGS